jgi:hypothetical protein
LSTLHIRSRGGSSDPDSDAVRDPTRTRFPCANASMGSGSESESRFPIARNQGVHRESDAVTCEGLYVDHRKSHTFWVA